MLTNEQVQKLVSLYSTGEYSHTSVSDITGISYYLVYKFYREWKIWFQFPQAKRKPRTGDKSAITNVKEAYEFYCSGATLEDVGIRYGITRERVRQIFRLHGLLSRRIWTQKRKKYFHCKVGHKLQKGEYLNTCEKCRKDRESRKKNGFLQKIMCKNGHLLQPPNLIFYIYGDGKQGRKCKQCCYARSKEYLKNKRKKKNATI